MFPKVYIVTTIFCCSAVASANASKVAAVAQDAVFPRVVIPGSGSEIARSDVVALYVDKSDLKAELKTVPSQGQKERLLMSFTVAIGKEKGDKEKRGDNKTPEGVYFTQNILQDAELPAKYGPNAIPLNYPNPIDYRDGKTGSGIWLHGVIRDERVEEANVTEGCVAFYNADIVKLTKWLQPHQGLVVIADRLSKVNEKRDLATVQEQTRAWFEAWRDRKIDEYISAYSDDFSYNGMSRAAYKDYKNRVFKSYKVMDVSISNMRVIAHPKYAISFMDQDFHGDKRFSSIGRKILYWRKNAENQWKIHREVYENRRLAPVAYQTGPEPVSNKTAEASGKSSTH